MADKPKYAMADGSYPINTCADVASAAKLAHNSKTYSFEQVKAHVMKAKNALGCGDDVLPETWTKEKAASRPPRDDLYRGVRPGVALRDGNDGSTGRILIGHFAVFNQWTEINSIFEGRFMERLAPGAFAKTFQENGNSIRALFQHGRDPQIGDKPLGPIQVLREDEIGAYYEVPLLDTSYNRDLIPGLESGLYGASFRFSVIKEEVNQRVERSEYNPDGIPERTIQELRCAEFGPVTFPAYGGATAGVRSLTDEFHAAQLLGDPDRLRQVLQFIAPAAAPALSHAGAETESHSNGESRNESPRSRPLVVVRNPNRRRDS